MSKQTEVDDVNGHPSCFDHTSRTSSENILLSANSRPVSLGDLPRELLEKIFVLSGNISLPQASLTIAAKLSRTPLLTHRLVMEQMEQFQIDAGVVSQWGFVDRSLLEQVGIKSVIGDIRHQDLDIETLAYMVELGGTHPKHNNDGTTDAFCIDDVGEVYVRLAGAGRWEAVSTLISSCAHRDCDYRAPTLALRRGRDDIALKLLEFTRPPTSPTQVLELWEAAEPYPKVHTAIATTYKHIFA